MDFNYINRNNYLEEFKSLIKTVITTSGNLIRCIDVETEENKQLDLFYYSYIPLYDLSNYYPFIKRFLPEDYNTHINTCIDDVQTLFSKLLLTQEVFDKLELQEKLHSKNNKKVYFSFIESINKIFPDFVKKIDTELQKIR